MVKNLARETPTECKFFELFYAMGDKRNMNQLLPIAKKIDSKVSYARLERVRDRNWWNERIKARDYNVIVTMQSSIKDNIDDLKLKYHDAIKNTISREFETKVVKGKKQTRFKIAIHSINDLEKSIKLLLLLAGEATDITSVKIEIVNTVIQRIINVVSLHIKDPRILSQIAIELNNVVEGD